MKKLVDMLRGFRGHPSHPPFTDITVGAYTTGTVLVVIGWFGVNEAVMVKTGLLATVVGLIAAALTILTGWLDYIRIPRGSSMRRTAAVHWISTISSTAIYVVSAAVLQAGSDSGQVSTAAALVSLAAWAVLLFGAWAGGSIVFIYGMRVLNETEAPTGEALKPKFPPD